MEPILIEKREATTTSSIYYIYNTNKGICTVRASDHNANILRENKHDIEVSLNTDQDLIIEYVKMWEEGIDIVNVGDIFKEMTILSIGNITVEYVHDEKKKYPADTHTGEYIEKYFDEKQKRYMVVAIGKSRVLMGRKRFEQLFKATTIRSKVDHVPGYKIPTFVEKR